MVYNIKPFNLENMDNAPRMIERSKKESKKIMFENRKRARLFRN